MYLFSSFVSALTSYHWNSASCCTPVSDCAPCLGELPRHIIVIVNLLSLAPARVCFASHHFLLPLLNVPMSSSYCVRTFLEQPPFAANAVQPRASLHLPLSILSKAKRMHKSFDYCARPITDDLSLRRTGLQQWSHCSIS